MKKRNNQELVQNKGQMISKIYLDETTFKTDRQGNIKKFPELHKSWDIRKKLESLTKSPALTKSVSPGSIDQ